MQIADITLNQHDNSTNRNNSTSFEAEGLSKSLRLLHKLVLNAIFTK